LKTLKCNFKKELAIGRINPKTISEDVKSIKEKGKPGTVAVLAKPWHK